MTAELRATAELDEAFGGLRPYLRRAACFTGVAALLVLAPSLYMLEVYDRVVNSRNTFTLAMLTLLVLGAFAVMELIEWARGQILHQAGVALDRKLGDRLFAAVFHANQRRMPGGTVQSMNDLRTLREFLASPAVHALMESPVSVVFLVVVFAIHPALGWAALIGALVQLLIGWLNERSTRPPLAAAARSSMGAQAYADATLRNAEVIAAMGMHAGIHRRWLGRQRQFLGEQALASYRAGAYQAITKFVQVTLGSLLIGLGAWLVLAGKLEDTGALLIVASILGARVIAPLLTLVTQWRAVIQFREAWARVGQLLAQVPPRPAGMPLPRPRGQLQVENLVAAPPGSQAPILKGIAFALEPGEACAVIGPSAAGKTTLTRMLIGLWPALNGKVRLDGADVHGWDKNELGPHIGYLPQAVELFDGTIAENIARFGEVDMAKVQAAAQALGLHEFIQSLPEGYDTAVGTDGAMLSAGQRQRVGVARAIYGDPVFVVLDEPNSSLDEAGDAALVAAIGALKKRGTTFVITTHRTSVFAVVDRILVLRDGQMQGFGPRDEVLAALQRGASEQRARLQAARPPAATATEQAA